MWHRVAISVALIIVVVSLFALTAHTQQPQPRAGFPAATFAITVRVPMAAMMRGRSRTPSTRRH